MPAAKAAADALLEGWRVLASVVEGTEARALSPSIAWPTLAMAALLLPAHLAIVALGVAGLASPWLLTPLLCLTAYAHYTIVHEAIHRNLVRERWFDRLNRMLGWWGSIAIGTTWPVLHRTHLSHHAHTNSARDADIFVKGSYPRLVGIWLVSIPANLIPVPLIKPLFDRLKFDSGYLDAATLMPENEWRRHLVVHSGLCLAVWTAVAAGAGTEMFALYVLPAAVARLLLATFQQWLPHFPFEEGDRYRMARIMESPVARLMCMGHDLHLVHHLWPHVPFYNYRRLFGLLRPTLEARGTRFGGLLPR